MNQQIRLRILEQSFRAGVGHIGSALSIADILAVLYDGTLEGVGADRERFVLSKGHAALALYAALCESGRIGHDQLDSYCADGTPFGGHPEHAVPEIDFSTGSLGHGLSLAAGAALAARVTGSGRRTFVLMSDAELNEGSVWEAAMFAAHHRLGRLIAIVDVNGQQALGYTRDVLDLEPLADRWSAFGWRVHEVDGHDSDSLRAAIAAASADAERPHVLLARTTFGHGVSYMESEICWHYWPMSEAQYADATAQVLGGPGASG